MKQTKKLQHFDLSEEDACVLVEAGLTSPRLIKKAKKSDLVKLLGKKNADNVHDRLGIK